MKPLVVLDIAALSPQLLGRDATPNLDRLAAEGVRRSLPPVFPAVTSVAQATLTTGLPPAKHGIIANGRYDRAALAGHFWEQAARLVSGKRIWGEVRRRERKAKTAVLFFQQSMGCGADVVVTPAPVHSEKDGLVLACYTRPGGLDSELAGKLGPFPLMNYWGPMAGWKSSEWIERALLHVMEKFAPTLTLCYVPHLDYNLQRRPPPAEGDPLPDWLREDLALVDGLVGRVREAAEKRGAALLVISDYTITPVSRPVYLNRALRQAKLLAVREIRNSEYLDLAESRAFALVDHQVAHVYLQGATRKRVRALLEKTPGVERVLDKADKKELGVDHARSGELIAVAARDAWFAYPWWLDDARAPDFARTVDIHRKPGYDPVELFIDPATKSIPLDAALVRGSHGRPPDSAKEGALLIAPAGTNIREGELRYEELRGVLLGILSEA